MSFKPGDIINVIDEDLEGTVVEVSGNSVTIETNEGFLMKFDSGELVKINPDASRLMSADPEEWNRVLNEKEHFRKKKKTAPVRTKKKQVPPMEVDLHIEKLAPYLKGLSSHDMLVKQLDTARGQLEFAIGKRIQRIVFIHGVGEGVLRAELEYLFSRYENIRYYDADYQKYGLGATEVYILQNGA